MNIINASDAALSNRPPHLYFLAHHMSQIWELSDLNPIGENSSHVIFFRYFQMLVGLETKIMHDYLLQRDILLGISLISERVAGNYFGPFRNSPKTAAPGGIGVGVLGWKGGRREGGESGGAWRWLGGEWELPRTTLLCQCGPTFERSDTNHLVVG